MLSYLSPLVREISLFYSIASTETQPYLLRYYSEINEFQLDWSKFILSRLVGIFFLLLRIVVPPFWPRWLIDDFCRKNWIHCHVDLQLEYSSHTLLTNMLSLFYCRFATQREYAIVASTDADAELDAACIFYPRDISLNDEDWFSYGWIIGGKTTSSVRILSFEPADAKTFRSGAAHKRWQQRRRRCGRRH